MRTAIVFYSMSGNTSYAAELAANALGGELIPIDSQKAYPDKGFRRFFVGGRDAVMGRTPPLLPYSFDAEKYDLVVIASPVWASRPAPPIRTFITENREALKNKRIAVILTSMGGGNPKAAATIAALAGQAKPEAYVELISPKDRPDEKNEAKLKAFIDALKN